MSYLNPTDKHCWHFIEPEDVKQRHMQQCCFCGIKRWCLMYQTDVPEHGRFHLAWAIDEDFTYDRDNKDTCPPDRS